MTIGGTRYFMGLRAKENEIAGPATDQNMLKSTVAPRARQASRIIA